MMQFLSFRYTVESKYDIVILPVPVVCWYFGPNILPLLCGCFELGREVHLTRTETIFVEVLKFDGQYLRDCLTDKNSLREAAKKIFF